MTKAELQTRVQQLAQQVLGEREVHSREIERLNDRLSLAKEDEVDAQEAYRNLETQFFALKANYEEGLNERLLLRQLLKKLL